MKKTKKNSFKKLIDNNLAFIIVLLSVLLCAIFAIAGTRNEDGSITLDGSSPIIKDYTKELVEDFESAMNRLMNEDKPTDDLVSSVFNEPAGQGFQTSLSEIKARRKPDGYNDNGLGLQCSKYTAYLATGRMEYSTSHPDYGPVNGKDVADWLVRNYGFKYVSTPVEGAIGSGGFNTLYGHTAMYLYSTGANTAMVNDANFTPLTVNTHNMDISGWVWVVPNEPEVTPTPPLPSEEVSTCSTWYVKQGDTMSKIMETCEGNVVWGETMNNYAKTWFSTIVKPNQSVYDGWNSPQGVGLYVGDVIERR